MEELRNYLQNTNGDIFEIIDKAIRVAASDYPLEFQNNKHKIVEALYSSSLIKSSGQCDDDKLKSDVPNDGSPKNQITPKKSTVVRIKLKKKAEDKTDGDTTESLYDKRIEEVLKIKWILENSQGESELVRELLSEVKNMGLGLNVLEATGIGKTVNVLQKHASKDVNQIAKTLIKQWKRLVDERFEKKSIAEKLSSQKHVKPTSTNMEISNQKAIKNQKGENSMEKKFEDTKRKLQHSYQEAENLKKRRKIHVIESQELSRHDLLPTQQRQLKNSNEQLRRRANVHRRIPRLVPTY